MSKKKYDITQKEIQEWLSGTSNEAPSAEELMQSEDALLRFAETHATPPPTSLREKILGKLQVLNAQNQQKQKLNINRLPLLNASSNWLAWKEVTETIAPPEDYENIHLHSLISSNERELFIAWVKEYVPEEVHYDLLESFLILEGSCECFITDEAGHSHTVRLGPGDFIAMEIGETHDIRITSEQPAKAILQWIKQAD